MFPTAMSSWYSRFAKLPTALRTRLLSVAVLAAIVVVSAQSGWISRVDNRLADLRFGVSSHAPSGDLVMVDIDAKSLREINVWPWPRGIYGELVEKAGRLGVARIAFDIDFSALAEPLEDKAFAEALSRSRAEVFLAGFVQRAAAGSSEYVPSLPHDGLLHYAWPAIVNVVPDEDGAVRHFPNSMRIGSEELASMPVVLSNKAPTRQRTRIDYSIAANELERISYVDFIYGELQPGSLSGKTLIVGATAIQLKDFFVVPVHGHISGSTLIALATETLLQDRQLAQVTPPAASLVILAVLALVASSLMRPQNATMLLLGISLGIELIALYLQAGGQFVAQTATIHLILVGSVLGVLVHEFDVRRLLLWVERIKVFNAQNMLERVIEDGFDGVVILDGKSRIVRRNKLATDLLSAGTAKHLKDLPPELSHLVEEVRDQQTDKGGGRAPVTLELLTQDGRSRTVEFSIVPFLLKKAEVEATTDANDTKHVCITIRDVTSERAALEKIRYMALHDGLTDAFNRAGFEMQFARTALVGGGEGWALLYFDLKGFKNINDGFGHTVGDEVLIKVVERANALFAEDGSVARMGGDEFLILLQSPSEAYATHVAEGLVAAFNDPFLVQGHTVRCGARVGVLFWDDPEQPLESLLLQADLALHKARKDKRSVVLFTPSLQIENRERQQFERDLELALDREQFEVAYQPQLDLQTNELAGVETLLRWHHPKLGPVSPVRFIPVAEEIGLIGRLGFWVMKRACADAAAWLRPIKVAVNVSALQFKTRDILADTQEALRGAHLAADRLEIEITESAFVDETDRLQETLTRIQELGVRFALDDFGTGYSSLAYLHRFPISKIKIDQSFVRGIPHDAHAVAVLRSVQVLAMGLGIKTIAEGIETAEQMQALKLFGCDEVQGYFYARPMDNACLHAFMEGSSETLVARSAS